MFGWLQQKRKTKRNHVFVFTYGRSGSTLLMGVLNSIPHYCIRGENGNALYGIYEATAAVEKAKATAQKNSEKPTHPWFGLNQVDAAAFTSAMADAFVDEVLKPEPHHTTTGFKEIRFSEVEVPDFDGYIAFVRRVFPGCRIIFNHRDLQTTAASKWWSNMPLALPKLQFMEDRFNSVPSGPDVFHFHYDRIADGMGHFRELFAFLQEPFDEAKVSAVLAVKHSY